MKDTLMGFKIIPKQYSSVKAIFAELGHDESILKRALLTGHQIDVDAHEATAPEQELTLYFVVTEEQKDAMRRAGIDSPTFLQLLGTCEVIATSEEEAVKRIRIAKGDPRA